MTAPDPKLLAIFDAEQREHVERIRALLAGNGGPSALEEAFRRAHTLKGAARAVGLEPTEKMAHQMEALFARVREGALALDGRTLATIRGVLDAAEDVLAAVLEGRAAPDVSAPLGAIAEILGVRPPPPSPAAPAAPLSAPETGPVEMVRAPADSVDRLVRSSSRLLSAVAAQDRAAVAVAALGRELGDAEHEWSELRRKAAVPLRRARTGDEFAPVLECLEFAGGRLGALAAQARSAVLESRRGAWGLRQLGEEVHREACLVRMVPAGAVFDGFRKMVRELARDASKIVDFRLEGVEVPADRLVLQRLKDPVMHLLRNAVAHGIEPPRERLAAGKPETGMVRLQLESRGGRLEVAVEDDGRGIDLVRVRETAVARGLLAPAEASSRPAADILRMVFLPGFSTAAEVTNLSGRGMGLSVVQEETSRLQGEAFFRPSPVGAAVVLSVPVSISTHGMLLVSCSGRTFGIPGSAVETLRRVPRARIERLEGAETVRIGDAPVPLASLAGLLDLPPAPAGTAPIPVAVLRSGERRLAVAADALLDWREALVKDTGLPPALSGLSAGGVTLEDGEVAVVLSPTALLDRFRRGGAAPAVAPAEPEPARPPSILVVDDSITTRSLEKSILEAHGYRVRVAVDGMEALERLRADPADLVITDVSMPRMDGFELVAQIKRDPALAATPVIIVTSLETPEEQRRGLELGADAYIVKRKFDQRQLLDTVRQIL